MPKRKGRRGKREKCVCTHAHVYKRMLTEELTKMLREMSSLGGEETGGIFASFSVLLYSI